MKGRRIISAQELTRCERGAMKKAIVKKRKSIEFSKGVRGKYAGMKLAVVGPTQDKTIEERRK